MAATVSTDMKYTFRYTTVYNNDSVSKSISGINIGSGNEFGPYRDNALNVLYTHFSNFTNGTITGGAWVSEQAVTF